MTDIAHKQTDDIIENLEKKLNKEYKQAYKEVEKKASEYFAKFEKADKEKLKLVADGTLTRKEYNEWRTKQMLTGKRWTDLRDTLAKDLTNANKIATAMIRGELNEVFALNSNYASYLIENGMRTNYGFTLYNRETVENLVKNDPDIIPWKPEVDVAKDLRWNKQIITSHITQGVLQGESVPNLSKRLIQSVNNNKVAATRTARTAITSSENAGRQMVYDKAKSMGIKVKKEWVATTDSRTRDWHGEADGQQVNLDEDFTVNGEKMEYPGDMSASAENVYNCFVGETKITSDSEIVRSYKQKYKGDLINIKTASGVNFTCSPNHPILTPNGWVCAKSLKNGNNILVTFFGQDSFLRVNPHINHRPARIDTIHKFGKITGGQRTCSMSVDFHGDVPTTDVEIITHKRLLRKGFYSVVLNIIDKFLFIKSDKSFPSQCSFFKHFFGIFKSSFGIVSRFCKSLPFFECCVSHSNKHCLRPISNSNTVLTKYSINDLPTDTVIDGELLDRISSDVFVDTIVDVDVFVSSCHIYNLQTKNGYYFVNSSIPQNKEKANGIYAIAKNCRCTMITVEPPNITKGEEPRMTYSKWVKSKQ